MTHKPLIAVTLGDPAGIGPEIAARALLDPAVRAMCRPVLIGDEAPLRWALDEVLHRCARVRIISNVEDAGFDAPDAINLYAVGAVRGGEYRVGEASAAGDAAFRYVRAAIELAMAGIDAIGPIPPDTVFSKLQGGLFDICVCMYHDQGHIPVKLLGFSYDQRSGRWNSVSGVNITLGLPIIRVSVDHGTAFDVAGRGLASPESLVSALDYAAKMSPDWR